MSSIEFACPSCEQVVEAPPELAGEVVACPSCDQPMTVPAGAPAAAPAADGTACPECGSGMEADAVLCTACGFNVKLGTKIETEFS